MRSRGPPAQLAAATQNLAAPPPRAGLPRGFRAHELGTRCAQGSAAGQAGGESGLATPGSSPPPMHTLYDHLGKKIGFSALSPCGPTEMEAVIAPDPRRADLRHEPDPARNAERARLGLLGRIA